MKKLLIAAIIAALALLGACNKNEAPEPTATPAATATAEPTAAPAVLVHAENASKVPDGWTIVAKYRFDIDDDGERETIRLCTDAQKGEDGHIELDDSHSWVLEMTDASNVFTLYNGYIHTGAPSFEVYEDKDAQKCINLTVTSGSDYSMKKFIYIRDKKAFEVQNIYSEENVNHLYSSMSMY